ncbi:MAG: NAD-dependent epimerase/dehydratase family protein, partial [Thermoanaerobaculia bacterium]
MKILVTGAAGFIASNLIPRLLERGDDVVGADNFFLGKRAYVARHPRFAFHELDLLDLDRVIALMSDFRPDRVWHL